MGEKGINSAGGGIARPTVWRRCAQGASGVVRFLPFARDAAMDRLRRTGPKAFVRDLPVLVKMGINYYRWVNPGGGDRLAPPPIAPYDAWMAVNRWTAADENDLRERLKNCPAALPKISVIMPVHNPPPRFLDAAISSVAAQIHGDWELCIADDQSTDPAVRQTLTRWGECEKRIRLKFCPAHGHISRTTNAAADLANGDFLLFLDHDDELTPDALAEVALHVAENPTTDFVYSDSDKTDAEGRRYDAEFKPEFSPELLLSYMYFSHVCAVRRELFFSLGGTRIGFEGSQDYDLALRATEKARRVGHIPRVLYHWRAIAGSTASNGAAKPDSFNAGRAAVQEALERRGMAGRAYQPDWAAAGALGIFAAEFPDTGPSVAILIPTKNNLEILRRCLKSLEKTTYRNYSVVIIDNESDDPKTLEFLAQFLAQSRHRVLRVSTGGRFNFAALNNRAAAAVDAELILLLNNDTEVADGRWLSRMAGYARADGVGAVGARLVYPDGRVQHGGIVHGLHHGLAGHAFKLTAGWDNGYLSHARLTRNYSAVTAACLLTPRKLFLEQGGLDEREFAVAYNDADYCYKLVDKGLRCVYVAAAELIHHEGLSRGFADQPAEVAAFRRKHGSRVDPYYSPHLSLEDERFRILPRRLARPLKAPIRACIFSHFLNLTGAPLIQYELTSALKKQGVLDPMIACVSDGPLRQWYEQIGAEVAVLGEHPLAPVLSRPDTYDQVMIDLGRKMKEQWKVDLVYANTLDTVFAVDAASRVGIPVIWNIHESEGWRAYFGRYGYPIARRCLENFAKPYRVIFGSEATRKVYAAWNSSHNFHAIRNPVDMTRLRNSAANWTRETARRSLNIAEDEIVFLTVGTLCLRKGQTDLVDALARIPWWLRSRMRCFFVGDQTEPFTQQLTASIQALGEETAARITLASETADVARYYLAADVFVCSSRVECYPRVTQEAMAFSLPLITTPVYGLAEQVKDGVAGIHYLPGNVKQLAEAMSKLATHPDLRRELGEKGQVSLEALGSFCRSAEEFGQICREAYSAAS